MGTVVLAGATSGSTTLTPVDAVTATITLPSATGTLAALGTPSFTTGIAVGGATAQAGGIAFPATQVSVSDVNTLDDYERGTFTPIVYGPNTTTYNSQSGYYIKIGRLVYIEMWLDVLSIGNGSVYAMQGFPFPFSIPGASRASFTVNYYSGAAVAQTYVAGYAAGNNTVNMFLAATSGAAAQMTTPTFFTSGTAISLSGCYYSTT